MSALETTPTTRLDAVNSILRSINETPVSSLSGGQGVDLPNAVAKLAQVTRSVLLEGWQFNREYNYPLPLSGTGEIEVPANALNVDVNRRGLANVDPVMRGNRMYDRYNHTFTFETGLEATVTFGLDFEDLPESARYYITYRACREFQDVNIGSGALHQFSRADELSALVAFKDQHSDDEDLNMIFDTPDFMHLR